MRICNKCSRQKSFDEFYLNRSMRNGRDSICKECRRAQRRINWAENHLGQRDRDLARYAERTDEFRHKMFVQRLRRVYNLTERQFLDLLAAQDGVCALCKQEETKVYHKSGNVVRLTIDHNHACCPSNRKTCGKCIRGLLCYECNLLIGKAEAKSRLVERSADYLDLRPFAQDVIAP